MSHHADKSPPYAKLEIKASWEKLTTKQKYYAHHLAKAANAGLKIAMAQVVTHLLMWFMAGDTDERNDRQVTKVPRSLISSHCASKIEIVKGNAVRMNGTQSESTFHAHAYQQTNLACA